MNLGFLASHRGTNMQAIIDACHDGTLAATPVVVISNNPGSGALERARQQNIPAFCLSQQDYNDIESFDAALTQTLQKHRVDLVVLAGYMVKIGPVILAAFPGRVINIHPALLPYFGGQGMYGKRVHEAVLAAGVKESGPTIHVVDDEYDTGPILAQKKVPVKPGDDVESLAARVLKAEHELYVDTIGKIISGEIILPLK